MILLTALKIPEGLNKDTLATAAKLMFPRCENEEYIEEIRSRKNDASACESLFALTILYEQIRSLPERVDTDNLIFARTESGKPYFTCGKVKFNLSHSRGYVACASSLDFEVGVDVEATPLPPERATKMAERYFSESEIKSVKASPDIFSKIWSEKEAKAKFWGQSLGVFLESERQMQNSKKDADFSLHSFAVDGIPVTLCTKRNFSTIFFSVQ